MKNPLRAFAASALVAASITVFGHAGAAPPAGRFVLEQSGTVVHDTKTNLRWERTADPTARPRPQGGTNYCTTLGLAGGGWRVPTIKELLTIVDRQATGSPKWPTAFFDGPAGDYWSSTTAYQNSASFYYVAFATGASATSDQNSRYFRCVK